MKKLTSVYLFQWLHPFFIRFNKLGHLLYAEHLGRLFALDRLLIRHWIGKVVSLQVVNEVETSLIRVESALGESVLQCRDDRVRMGLALHRDIASAMRCNTARNRSSI